MVTLPETTNGNTARALLLSEGLYDDLVAKEQRLKRNTPEEAAVRVDAAITYYMDSLGPERAAALMNMPSDERAGKLYQVVGFLIDGVDFSGVEGRTSEVDHVIRVTREMIKEIDAQAVSPQRAQLRAKVRNSAATRQALGIGDNNEDLDRVIKMAIRNVVIKYGPDNVNQWEGPELSVAIDVELDAIEAAKRNTAKWTAEATRGRIGPTSTTRALGGSGSNTDGTAA